VEKEVLIMRYGVFCLAALAAFAQTTRQGNDTERARLSDMASRMLERTVQARAALDKGDQGMARHYVEEALNNTTAIEIAQPKAPSPRMVTLYTETVQIAVEKPKPVGAQGSADRQQEPPVQEVTGESTRVAVNVTDAKKQLQAARDAIDKGDLGAARQSLAAVDADVKAESRVGDLPLIKARQNLSYALDDMRQQHFEDAVAPLRAASAGLKEYAQGQSGHAKDARELGSRIDALAGSVQQDHNGADAKIAGWSREINGWIQPLNPPQIKR
jgi:hypothetical protein